MPAPPLRSAVDALVADLDRRLCATVNALLHHPAVQQLEALWRSLAELVRQISPHDNIRVELLCARKADLAGNLHGLEQVIYTRALASHGGQPYGLVCATYSFGPSSADLALLRACGQSAQLAHAPFVADAAPSLLGLDSLAQLTELRDLSATHASPHFAGWSALRTSPEARYLALCLPRALARVTYDDPTDLALPPGFIEHVDRSDHRLWGPACLVLAARAAAAFASQRWCVGLVGSHHGARLLGLEVSLPPRSEQVLADAGLLAFTVDRAEQRVILRNAPSLLVGSQLAAQLPYVLLLGRLAHYLQRIQREGVGQWDDAAALQRALEQWLRNYTADMDDPPPDVRARKPLRRASVRLVPLSDEPGWHRCHLTVVPHLTHVGRPLELELSSRIELSTPPAKALND